ncbi:2-phosphoglycolate phosphatase [Wallemia mellicola]|uniref:4-nitrophenylphosphatase n=1 Tax=Wallemia mellicola TaxID=1708541 RepID=A0A4V4MNV2_9BASI|nr:hypothetical protein E3Q24_03792 [Wallemia mellicola]TIB71108.1 hypothetical protein E3Q23_03914 [Wallemia mellicola]TIB75003.1 2-phosphoglycolate phosphatase [Wallemia mellicola]TIB80215.1 2-phosphoglycolate phosphatase [Wallemia mellicola]TIB83680.1 2-phosphoglycolate phosphatase [Wallemia mellicola]
MSTIGFEELINKYTTVLFDCDGVLWRGNELIPGSKEFIDHLRKHNKRLIFVTNNASQSREQYRTKFQKFGLDVSTDEIYGSAYAATVYLKYKLKSKKAFVIGMSGLEHELDTEGIEHIGGTSEEYNKLTTDIDFKGIKDSIDPSVDTVLCGMDLMLNYSKLSHAFSYLENKNVNFVLTNDDSTFPQSAGIFPGSGSLSAPLILASGRTPTVVGKPNKEMLDCILDKNHLNNEETLMIGDRLNTDIKFGQKGGLDTLLVLSGVSKREDIEKENIYPKYILNSLDDLN